MLKSPELEHSKKKKDTVSQPKKKAWVQLNKT